MISKFRIRSKYTIWLVNVFKAVLMLIYKQLTTSSCRSFSKFRNCKPHPLSGIEFQTEGEATLKARAPKAVDTEGESSLC